MSAGDTILLVSLTAVVGAVSTLLSATALYVTAHKPHARLATVHATAVTFGLMLAATILAVDQAFAVA
jgi:hypothetical protein